MLFQRIENPLNRIPGKVNWINWVRHNELTIFFILTFVFSWSIYLVAAVFNFNNQTVFSRVLLIAGFGPALSAVLISTVISTKRAAPTLGKRVVLFLLVFAFGTAMEWLDHILWKHSINASLIIADAILITLAAVVISSLYSNHNRVRKMMLPITQWRVNFVWYLVALGLWPLIIVAGNIIAHATNMPLVPSPDRTKFFAIAEYFIWFLLFGGPLNEEPGWRGFALPRLQGRFSPLIASLILGTLWGLWHVPLHFMGVYFGGAWGAIIRIQELPRAILFTWIYNRTRGSLLIVLLFHTAINTAGYFLPRSFLLILAVCTLIAIVVAIKERMWKRLPDMTTFETKEEDSTHYV